VRQKLTQQPNQQQHNPNTEQFRAGRAKGNAQAIQAKKNT
jgi:hypothetical protein